MLIRKKIPKINDTFPKFEISLGSFCIRKIIQKLFSVIFDENLVTAKLMEYGKVLKMQEYEEEKQSEDRRIWVIVEALIEALIEEREITIHVG